MEEKKKGSKLAAFFSTVYLLAALCLLLGVVGRCFPSVEQRLRTMLTGWEDNPLQEAFHTLADGLEAGLPVGETVEASIEVLFPHAD